MDFIIDFLRIDLLLSILSLYIIFLEVLIDSKLVP